MKQYNVVLIKGVDYDAFWNDMESDTDDGTLHIPNRRVQFTNERIASLRQCWYLLTEEEAKELKLDERVFDVEIPVEYRDDIKIELLARQSGNFTKTTSSSGSFLNWGMIRCNGLDNSYGDINTTTLDYTYSLVGEGVDVVIQDSGIQTNHPEFNDEYGNNRVQQINWFTESGIAGTQSPNHYRDFDGHGTHVAGTLAGLTYGWAKGADIYSQKLQGLEGSGDGGTGISPTNAFDAIKLWHRNKPINPATGYKRPTVVNMSWGFIRGYNTISELSYRGVSYTDNSTLTNAGFRESNYGLNNISGFNTTFLTNVRVSSVDIDLEEMIDEGIHICIAAGNNGNKIELEGGVDYNNYIVTASIDVYYHRGSSPYSTDAINVGNIDRIVGVVGNVLLDKKASSSETGPGVDIYAPGTNIMSACSNTNEFFPENYYLNSSFKQVNISGTSMASPQVAGVVALILQLNPAITPYQLKQSLLESAGNHIFFTENNDDWSDRRSLYGGIPNVLFNKFNQNVSTTVSGEFVNFVGIGI